MDIQVTNKVIGTTESLFDDFDERPVDCDFVLPDYLPDIAAVLKCTMKPVVQSNQLSGDRLIADGVANLRVLYLDEARKCVRSCEFTQPFTSTFNVKNAGSAHASVSMPSRTTSIAGPPAPAASISTGRSASS